MKYVAPLRADEIQTLHDLHRYHPSGRARMRAHSLLLSHRGWAIPHIAQFYQADRRSVSTWIDRWQTMGLVGVYDQPSSGRPPLLNDEEQHKVYGYLQQYPKDLKKVVQALEQETTKRVSTKTIKRLIKKRYIWKRIKKSPAKAPDPHKYERSKGLIYQLQQREAAGVCDLWYFDVAGFCLTPCIPYAWQPIGEVITVPASSHGRRLNVLGFLKRTNALVPYMVEGKVDTSTLVESFEQFSQQLAKRTYVFLDNAPVHRSQEFIGHRAQWVQRGLIIKDLPAYAPELNLLEILWRFMKYYWIPFSAYASFSCLYEAIAQILTCFGTEYTITFQGA